MWLFDLKQQINYIPVEHDWVRPIHQTFSINFFVLEVKWSQNL